MQLFNLNDTKEYQTNNDSSLWNDEEAKFVASLAQAICSKLSLENDNSNNSTQPPKTCGIITFYQKHYMFIIFMFTIYETFQEKKL